MTSHAFEANAEAALVASPSSLHPGEIMLVGGGFPAIAYLRPGHPDKPLVVFFPGGGHLARIAYGHPGADPKHFIDFWLAEAGYGLLALSYPTDHPAYDRVYPKMTVGDWGRSFAEITRAVLDEIGPGRPIVFAGWSMGGRPVQAFNVAAEKAGLNVIGFISLAATAPIMKLAPSTTKAEAAAANDTLLDYWTPTPGSLRPTREDKWQAEIARQGRLAGRPIMSAQDYRTHYAAAMPIRLRGEPLPTESDNDWSMKVALEDLGTFDYARFPLSGVIAPSDSTDPRHALTDQMTWGFYNAQKLYCLWHAFSHQIESKDADAIWAHISDLAQRLPVQLFRRVTGGHFFFLGEPGARAAAKHLVELAGELSIMRAGLEALQGRN
ncbi:hypothetical protein CN233_24305 [Sinorhizobium meliloti]|uniref:alpha/beta hydrolase n=1 Tax=Rhizobium meliloti TaxID=382 RepID=UPI000FDA9391|nr:alpha/beta fold hydrolase [Sinorhizobium meliloti]RVG26263.1 hypothetical protein CN233_24305 [Sinorhizobium meliloti]